MITSVAVIVIGAKIGSSAVVTLGIIATVFSGINLITKVVEKIAKK